MRIKLIYESRSIEINEEKSNFIYMDSSGYNKVLNIVFYMRAIMNI